MEKLFRKCPKLHVRRCEPVLVPPKEPTPQGLKNLPWTSFVSHNEQLLQIMVPFVVICPPNPCTPCKDPAAIVKEALAQALVFFYPLAGRVKQCRPHLAVQCTGDGVVFVEADSDSTVSELSDLLQPPYPHLNEILCDVPGMNEVFNSPILHVQVTRLKCGGFILAIRYINIVINGECFTQFLSALGELIRGASYPSILPIWDSHRLLFTRLAPASCCTNPAFAIDYHKNFNFSHRIFHFTSKEIAILRNHVPPHLQNATLFELLTGFLWRCRMVALSPEEDVRLVFAMNNAISRGFCSNSFGFTGSLATAGEICKNVFGYAVEMVVKAQKTQDMAVCLKPCVEHACSKNVEPCNFLCNNGAMMAPCLKPCVGHGGLKNVEPCNFLCNNGAMMAPCLKPCVGHACLKNVEPCNFLCNNGATMAPCLKSCGEHACLRKVESFNFLCNNGEAGEYVTVLPISLPSGAMKIFEVEIYSTLKIRGVDPFINQGCSNMVMIRSNI